MSLHVCVYELNERKNFDVKLNKETRVKKGSRKKKEIVVTSEEQ